MNLIQLSALGFFSFLGIFFLFLFTFTKSDEKIVPWSFIVIILFGIILASWWTKHLALQWVLIESTTLFGAILISLSKTEKAIDIAWKFLLLNSFGLGIAFLGIILLSFGLGDGKSIILELEYLIPKVPGHENFLVEAGIWFAIFGYSAKLGLFPNHFWVGDTYSEGPSQVSSILSAFLPVSVALAVFPFLRLDDYYQSPHFNSRLGFLVLGLLTMLYSLWTVYQTTDIRRITALIALFHSGGIAIIISFIPEENVLYYVLGANISVKSLLFSCMGILRIDLGFRDLLQIDNHRGISQVSIVMFLLALGMSFVFPLSPFFVSDLLLIRLGMEHEKFWILIVPVLGLVFFLVCLSKFLPLLNLPRRKFMDEEKNVLQLRVRFTFILFFISLVIGIVGIYEMAFGDM